MMSGCGNFNPSGLRVTSVLKLGSFTENAKISSSSENIPCFNTVPTLNSLGQF